MGEYSKIKILSNDLIRRLKNSSEELGRGGKVEIVDNYSQMLPSLIPIVSNPIKVVCCCCCKVCKDFGYTKSLVQNIFG